MDTSADGWGRTRDRGPIFRSGSSDPIRFGPITDFCPYASCYMASEVEAGACRFCPDCSCARILNCWGVLWTGITQLSDIVSKLPQYQENIRRKIEAMRNPAGSGFAKAVASINQISSELSRNSVAGQDPNKPSSTTNAGKRSRNGPETRSPLMVEVVKHQPGIFDSLGIIGPSFAHFIAVAGAVVVLTLFMLMQRGDVRNRLIQLFGQGHLNVMTTALDDAAFRVSRYLLTQSIINGSFGLLLGLGLYWIGVPNAPFWGVLGAILRFIPYIGTLIAGICPLLLAVAVFDGWIRPMLTLGLFATIEIAMSAAVELGCMEPTPASLH